MMIHNDHSPLLCDCHDSLPSIAIESPELVAVERRRRLLTYLQHESESTTVDELVDALCDDGGAVESTHGDVDRDRNRNRDRDIAVDRPSTTATSANRHDLRIYLHHTDLPILEDAGLIEYDAAARRVEIV